MYAAGGADRIRRTLRQKDVVKKDAGTLKMLYYL
jgi:hypothetical protein